MWYLVIGGCVLMLAAAVVIVIRRRRRRGVPISIVALRSSPRRLTEADVRAACRKAMGMAVGVQRLEPDANTVCYLVTTESAPPVGIIDSSVPYADADSLRESAERSSHPTTRGAIANHAAWIGVDAMGVDSASVGSDDRSAIYGYLGKIAAALLDEESLLLWLPADNLVGGIDATTPATLRSGKVASVFGVSDFNDRITSVKTDDAAIAGAIAEAQRRLPEFCAALESPGGAESALFKARFKTSDGGHEYVWLTFSRMGEGDIRGEIVNHPLDPSIPKKGSIAAITLDEIVDWAYVDRTGKSHGLFVERLLSSR